MFEPVKIFFVLMLLFLTACTSQSVSSAKGKDWIAFSADKAQADQMLDWLFPAEAEYWSPTEADIRAVEEDLPAYLQENQSAFLMTESPVWEQLEEYNRQYVGVILEGRKVIYANYLCRNGAEVKWQEQFVFVLDGGACYFQFKYDTSAGQFFDLQVNGDA